jgi:hypothetical protein
MKKVIIISPGCLLILFFLNSCPALFKDVEAININNESIYTINFFVDNEYENTIAPGNKFQTARYTNEKYSLLCASGSYKWGPKTINLKKGKPYTWTIKNPTPDVTGDIVIFNNTLHTVVIFFSKKYQGYLIKAGENIRYTEKTGIYDLYALTTDGSNLSWNNTIDLT